jgi:hypothetical protein
LAKTTVSSKIKRSIIPLLCFFSICFSEQKTDSLSADTLKINLNELESKVMSTLMFGGSSPVSFSGEGRMKLQYHYFLDCPSYARVDRNWTQANWEGNEDMLRLGMVVRANRNTVLWSKIGFQNTLPGITKNGNSTAITTNTTDNLGYSQDQTSHDKLDVTATIHEDMCGGIAIRTIPASFWFKMGNILWTEASPFTIWKSQPRNFGWDFLPYEIEQPTKRYYDYNVAKGAKEGRASWHKKALNGIELESINLPWDLYLNAIYGIYERYDSQEREFVDWSNDLGYADATDKSKQQGIGDSYHHVLHLRVAKSKLFGGLTLGANFMKYMVQDDIKTNSLFRKTFGATIGGNDTAFYKEPLVGSIDLKGQINDHLEIHSDLALSVVDSTYIHYETTKNISEFHSSSPLAPAFYGHIKSNYVIPADLDIACISKYFYSPMSFAAPIDAFYPFGTNLIGAGKFLARGEASPYAQNMAGALLAVMPDLGSGHFKLSYGQHFQLETARDLIYFPNRLNGQDFWSLFHSSYNRWGVGAFDIALGEEAVNKKYVRRLGDESFNSNVYAIGSGKYNCGQDDGGVRFDYLSTYEGFVPYEDSIQAVSNYNDNTSIFTRSAYVPKHRKYTFNLELDASYDISPLIGYKHDFYIAGYGAINGVSTSFTPLALNQDDQLLWSWFVRFEPAFAFSDKFYIIGLAGFENWKADKAYMNLTTTGITRVPINYYDYAYGLGFDWEMASRVGLHTRLKWMQHEDVNYTDNNWATPVVSTEIKMWF